MMTSMEQMFADVRAAESRFNVQLERQFGCRAKASLAKASNNVAAFDEATRAAYYELVRLNKRLNHAAMRLIPTFTNLDGEAA